MHCIIGLKRGIQSRTVPHFSNPDQNLRTISFPYKGGVHVCETDQIIRLEADSNYTRIYLTGKKHFMMATVLRDYESVLRPLGFVRTHRSHLVNAKHVAEVGPGGKLRMRDETCVDISRRKKAAVLRLFGNKLSTKNKLAV